MFSQRCCSCAILSLLVTEQNGHSEPGCKSYLSHIFCEEDNLAYEEVLADYFLNDDDGQDEEDYDQESFIECKF